MNHNPKHLEVVLTMEEIEAGLVGQQSRDPKLFPHLFAEVAWSKTGGVADAKIRATGNIGSYLVLSVDERPEERLVLAYVAIPKVIFAGWVVCGDVPHPWRVIAADLRDVRELLPYTWAAYLNRPPQLIPNTALGYLSTPRV